MELISYRQLLIVEDQLKQIREAIHNLQSWNEKYQNADDFLISPDGMKTLAADCMLIEAIGEGIRRIDEKTKQQLLILRPEIPWEQVKGIRDHIAHGYFDINNELIWDVIHNDLEPLLAAINFFIEHLFKLIPFSD